MPRHETSSSQAQMKQINRIDPSIYQSNEHSVDSLNQINSNAQFSLGLRNPHTYRLKNATYPLTLCGPKSNSASSLSCASNSNHSNCVSCSCNPLESPTMPVQANPLCLGEFCGGCCSEWLRTYGSYDRLWGGLVGGHFGGYGSRYNGYSTTEPGFRGYGGYGCELHGAYGRRLLRGTR